VQGALAAIGARASSRTAQIAHNVLVRAIRHAERDDLVGRNVAALVKPPKGQLGGRPSKSLTLEQAVALMGAARGTRLEAYVVLSLLSGLRTEEARALRWDHVVARVSGHWVSVSEAGFDHEQLAVFVWRADRAGSDTKTPRSGVRVGGGDADGRPQRAADVPGDHGGGRAGYGVGAERVAAYVRVAAVSSRGAAEAIALLAGHNQTATTELVYRHQIVPALTRGAEVMDQIFGS